MESWISPLRPFGFSVYFTNDENFHLTAKTFCFVPVQDCSQSLDDKKLYAKYNLSAEEINFIESTIKPMD